MGDSPVPPGHWPGGRSRRGFLRTLPVDVQAVFFHSGRRVAGRHRQVACAAHVVRARLIQTNSLPAQVFYDGFGAGVDVEFSINVGHVSAQRAGAHAQIFFDFLVAEPLGKLSQNLALTRTQPLQLRCRARRLLKIPDHLARHFREKEARVESLVNEPEQLTTRVAQATCLCRSATRRPERKKTACVDLGNLSREGRRDLPPGRWPGGTGESPMLPFRYDVSGLERLYLDH